MKTHYIVALAAAAGIAIGAAAVETLHAQAKPPGFLVAEIDVSNVEAYNKEFLPLASKALDAGGAKFLVRGGKHTAIDGPAPPQRVVISQFESLEKAVATYQSPEYREARKIGDKYAKFRIWAAEGVAPK
ncbi:MAG TPA: DUF1330 domain-containing protein [Pseudolabrys sp.]|nr:DUF1330 domain-containing protein [Pseudolabrys sp.]